jgi:hypothetical protein
MDFRAALAGRLPSVSSVRPLGTALAWLLYRTSGDSLIPVQLFNVAFTLAAWWTLARAILERRTFALLGLVAGGVFFSGYLFLFHLHGIFYGPLLLLLAVMVATWRAGLTPRALALLLALSVVTALIHPFALLFDVALVAGALIERRALRTPAGIALAVLSGAVAWLTLALTVTPSRVSPLGEGPAALAVSFRMIEVHPLISLVAVLVTALAAGQAWRGRAALLAAVLALACGALAWRAGGPVLPLWVAAAALKAARRGWWALVALLGSAFVLPFASTTGSPTYALFALMLCAAITALGEDGLEARLAFVDGRATAGVAIVTAALALALRAGVPVPIVSRLAHPLLAERERTHQLETLVARVLHSPLRDRPLCLLRRANSPALADNAVDRTHRPPTQEVFFDPYLNARRGGAPPSGDTLWIGFGSDREPGLAPLIALPGRFAGEADVFARPGGARP